MRAFSSSQQHALFSVVLLGVLCWCLLVPGQSQPKPRVSSLAIHTDELRARAGAERGAARYDEQRPTAPPPGELDYDPKAVLALLETVYASQPKGLLNGAQEREISRLNEQGQEALQHRQARREFVYGELSNEGFLQIFKAVRARPGEVYVDLGAGGGKSSVLAWAVGLRGLGIELLDRRFNASCAAVARLARMRPPRSASSVLRLQSGSFTKLDFSAADIVFSDSVMFSEATMSQLSARARGLKRGARIVTYKKFQGADFADAGTIRLNVSWSVGSQSQFHLQTKLTESRPVSVDEAERLGLGSLTEAHRQCALA